MPQQSETPAWILWPARVLAVILVLPFRLLWEGLKLTGRFLVRYVGEPLAWLFRHVVVIPLAWVWRYLIAVPVAFLWRCLVAIPLTWLWRAVAVPAGRAILRWIVRPLMRAVILPVLTALLRVLEWITHHLLAPVGRALLWILETGWRGTTWLGIRLYRWVLRPVGIAIGWVWRYTFGAVFRGIAIAGRWTRTEIIRPAAQAIRSAFAAIGF